MFLAAEPLLSEYNKQGDFFNPPDTLSFCQVDEVAIAGYDGEMDIRYISNDLQHGETTGEFDMEWWAKQSNGEILTKRVKCLTLDSWFALYSHYGFTSQIDNLSISFNGNAADSIFEAWSFNPRPRLIVIRQPPIPLKAIKKMELHNYEVHLCNGNVIGFKC